MRRVIDIGIGAIVSAILVLTLTNTGAEGAPQYVTTVQYAKDLKAISQDVGLAKTMAQNAMMAANSPRHCVNLQAGFC